jgi:hypothetical protein
MGFELVIKFVERLQIIATSNCSTMTNSSTLQISTGVLFNLFCLCIPRCNFFNFIPPKLLVYTSSYAQSVIYL